MAMKIVILEDNAERRSAMRKIIADHFSAFDTHFFDESAAMIAFLDANLADTIAISLDNDLDMKPGPDGRSIDVGEGCHVADFLATRAPVCPVVIATTNTGAAIAMTEALRAAGWKTRRVVPFDDTAWVATDWLPAMRRSIVGPRTRGGEVSIPS